jgi:hypothetical protein
VSEKGALVIAFEATDFFLNNFQFDGELVERAEDVVLSFGVAEVRHCGVDFHRLPGDLAAGITDLLNGGGPVHICVCSIGSGISDGGGHALKRMTTFLAAWI